jgi:neutral ceramidase
VYSRRLWILAVILCLALSFSAQAATLQAGAAKVDITPEGRVPLAGYFDRLGKKSRGIHDHVYARALVLEAGDVKLAVVSADILLIIAPLKGEVLDMVEELELDGLVLAATHTHSGPGGYVDIPAVKIAVMGGYHPEVRELLVEGMAKALRDANKNLVTAKFGSAIGRAEGLSRNRRYRERGLTDPSLGVVRIASKDDATIAYLINFAAHPTVLSGLNRNISGDYAGELEREVESFDQGSVAMFIPGALGDQSLLCPKGTSGFECVEEAGEALAERVKRIAGEIRMTDDVSVTYLQHMIEMPEFEIKRECFFGFAPLMSRLGKGLIRDQAEIVAARINDTILFATPAEIACEIGIRIKQQHPGEKVFVMALCNDYLGYVLTPEEYEAGGYESCMNFYGPEFEPYLEDQVMELLGDNRP